MNAKVMSRPLNSIPGFALDGFPVSDSQHRAHTHGDGMDAPLAHNAGLWLLPRHPCDSLKGEQCSLKALRRREAEEEELERG